MTIVVPIAAGMPSGSRTSTETDGPPVPIHATWIAGAGIATKDPAMRILGASAATADGIPDPRWPVRQEALYSAAVNAKDPRTRCGADSSITNSPSIDTNARLVSDGD